VQRGDRDQREGQRCDLAADGADGLTRPQQQEVAVGPQRRPGLAGHAAVCQRLPGTQDARPVNGEIERLSPSVVWWSVSRFYITTPIYYVNDAPHIGHAYTTVVADAMSRWHRLLGDETWFLTGTDEHGLKVQRAAEAHGVSARAWADTTVERFKDTWRLLNISNDDFIRTTEPRHYRGVEKLLNACRDAGDIELGVYEGLYCVHCEAYYTESELVNGNCPIHDRPVESVQEENYFFKLSRFEQRLLDWYAAHPDAVQPDTKRNEV